MVNAVASYVDATGPGDNDSKSGEPDDDDTVDAENGDHEDALQNGPPRGPNKSYHKHIIT